jgi:Cdc6-like AAA superfamily ATPase
MSFLKSSGRVVALVYFSFSEGQQQPTSLVGVDDILKESFSFCLRSFFLQSQSNDMQGGQTEHEHFKCADSNVLFIVPGLLVTGRKGFGKTSITQAVAKKLQEDLKTLTCAYLFQDLLH